MVKRKRCCRRCFWAREVIETVVKLHFQMMEISFVFGDKFEILKRRSASHLSTPIPNEQEKTQRILCKITRRGHSSFDFCWMVFVSLWSSIMCINLNNKRTLSRRIVDSIPLRNQQINDASKKKKKNITTWTKRREKSIWGRNDLVAGVVTGPVKEVLNLFVNKRDLNLKSHYLFSLRTLIPTEDHLQRWRRTCVCEMVLCLNMNSGVISCCLR